MNNTGGYYGFTAGGWSVGSGASTSGSSNIGNSIVDSGTTLIYLPPKVAASYWSNVPGSKNSYKEAGYIFPCSSTLPDFNVEIAGSVFTVPGSYLNYSSSSGDNCFGGLQSDVGLPFSIFGVLFLESVYAVFKPSGSSPQLGFANQS